MKICWFGIYNPQESRNRIYMRGLKTLGFEIVECRTTRGSFGKYFDLFLKHLKLRNEYDFLMVGYPGHSIVWFAKLISKKPVIFDALCTMEEGVLISRNEFKKNSLKYFYIKFIDWISVKTADLVLVESKIQKKFFEKKFGKSDKYKVVYTGADDSVFYPDLSITKEEKFTAVFRGKFLPEAGVTYILKAAKILEDSQINFRIIGNGWLEKEIKKEISELNLKNIELISKWLSDDEMRAKMLECHVSLGQFEGHERLGRTIPHKAFETMALGMPYITARAGGISEILTDGVNCLMVNPADPQDLAEKILRLKNDLSLAQKISENSLKLFLEKFSPIKLAENIFKILTF